MEPLFQPLALKGLTLKNRLIHVPTTLNMSDPRGHVTPQCVGAYESIARGGVGAVTVGATCVRWDGLINERMLGIYDDTYIIGLRDLADVIRRNRAMAGIQLFYGGLIPGLGATTPPPPGLGWIPGTVSWGPSDQLTIGNAHPGIVPTDEYEKLVEAYAQAGRRAKEAGFDYLSYHFCHGSLPHTNLSLLSNTGRSDKYADRFLFVEEILQRTRELCGDEFPLIPRLCCDENLEGGYDIAYFVEHYAPRLHALGIAALDCTFGSMLPAKSRRTDIKSTEFIGGNFYTPKVVNLDNIKTIRRLLQEKGISMPVIGSCNIGTPEEIRTMAYEGGSDMVGICRLSLDDPDFANKMLSGRDDEICKSTHTGASLLSGNIFNKSIAGSPQNPAFGRDHEYRIHPTALKKKVVVVGGGSGGMEYARVAKLSGHDVVLFERSHWLGGVMDWAGNYPHIPNTEQIRYEPDYRRCQVELLKIDCRLGVAADVATILAERPDVVVIATGARAKMPLVPGLEEARQSGFVRTIDELLVRDKPADPGRSVVVWGAGEGLELALELARQGRQVRLLDSALAYSAGLSGVDALRQPAATARAQAVKFAPYLLSRSAPILGWLAEAGVQIESGIHAERIEPGRFIVRRSDQTTESIDCDTLVICHGRESENVLESQLVGKVATLHMIGDACAPRSYGNSVHEAAYLARQI